MAMTATEQSRLLTNGELQALAIEANSLTEKMQAAYGKLSRQYQFADDVTEPAFIAGAFTRLIGEAGNLTHAMLAIMAHRERLAAAPPQGEN